MFEQFSVRAVTSFSAELRLFDGVDQASITVCLNRNRSATHSPHFAVFRPDGDVGAHGQPLELSMEDLKREDYVLPIQFGSAPLAILDKLRCLPRFGDLEGRGASDLWAGRELDETGHKRYLTSAGDYAFLKGRMVDRYQAPSTPEAFVDPEAGPPIPESADRLRIAWRDVSRPSQKRRMRASLISPGWVTGNSLHVAYFRDEDPLRTRALLVIMNSFVFELQVRSRLSTGHVSLGVVRRAFLPKLSNELVGRLASLADGATLGDPSRMRLAEVGVARAYGLGCSDLESIVRAFPKVEEAEVGHLIKAWNASA